MKSRVVAFILFCLHPLLAFCQAPLTPEFLKKSSETLINSASFDYKIINPSGDRELILFADKFKAEGVLLFYWELSYRGVVGKSSTLDNLEILRAMRARFFPDDEYKKLLPRFSDSYQKETSRIFLYHGAFKAYDLKTDFKCQRDRFNLMAKSPLFIHDGFVGDEIGYVAQKVSVELEGLHSVFDSAHRFVFAKASNLKVVETNRSQYKEEALPDFRNDVYLSRPWASYFSIKQNVAILEHPDENARPLAELKEGDFVELVRMPKPGWALVKKRDESGSEFPIGYLSTSKMWLLD